MTRRDTEFDAEGVTLRPSAAEAALVRPLGAFERMYHRYQQRITMHFCVAAEPADDLDPSAPDVGLLAVQHRHPALNVYVEEGSRTRLGVSRPAAVPQIPVTVVDAGTGRTWRDLVGEELARRFDTFSAPGCAAALTGKRRGADRPDLRARQALGRIHPAGSVRGPQRAPSGGAARPTVPGGTDRPAMRRASRPLRWLRTVRRNRWSRSGLPPRPRFGPSTARCPTSAPSPSTRTSGGLLS
jgi:hypothetical protein